VSRFESWWCRVTPPFFRKWAFTAWYVGFAAWGIVSSALGYKVGTVEEILLFGIIGLLGVGEEYWSRKAKTYLAMARLLAEQCDRLEQGD
jgi:hypothetical protein